MGGVSLRTRDLVEFALGIRDGGVPADVRTVARHAIADGMACLVAGWMTPPAEQARAADPGAGSPAGRALAYGAAMHALDFDDVSLAGQGHVTAVVLPALLASLPGGCAGRSLVTAHAVGYECAARIGGALGQGHYARGWHPTATIGTLAASLAVSRLLELDPDTATAALALAATQASGLRANFGTAAKPLHAGLAARNAVASTLLARAGARGAPGVMEAPNGYLALFGADPDPIPEGWAMARGDLCLKLWPSCASTHRAIAAALRLREMIGGDASRLAEVRVRVSPLVAGILPFRRPATPDEARFSLPYTVACALRDGEVRLGHFLPEVVRERRDDELLAIVKVEVDGDLPRSGPGSEAQRLLARPDGGPVLEIQAPEPPGTVGCPLDDRTRWDKWSDCFAFAGRPDAGDAWDLLESLDSGRSAGHGLLSLVA